LDSFARVPLLFGPSPVHRLEGLSEHLDGEVEIWAKRDLTADHIIPVSRGGGGGPRRVLGRSCNSKRADRPV